MYAELAISVSLIRLLNRRARLGVCLNSLWCKWIRLFYLSFVIKVDMFLWQVHNLRILTAQTLFCDLMRYKSLWLIIVILDLEHYTLGGICRNKLLRKVFLMPKVVECSIILCHKTWACLPTITWNPLVSRPVLKCLLLACLIIFNLLWLLFVAAHSIWMYLIHLYRFFLVIL